MRDTEDFIVGLFNFDPALNQIQTKEMGLIFGFRQGDVTKLKAIKNETGWLKALKTSTRS
ncbi:unnamed protein product [Sphenostylis stenocarpa]|uniref:Uncharacterized protein n=1 Tax=Sphenostylis stenocarpa TaxID=92480 RepID=A0AA86SPR9_9FABA|nr:unnamed protein product [Sphenostylis stenocarpa]